MANQLDSFKVDKLKRIPSQSGEENNLRQSQHFDRKS